MLFFYKRLKQFQITGFGTGGVLEQGFADLHALLQDRQRCLQFVDRRLDGFVFGLFLPALMLEDGELVLLLGHLPEEKLTLNRQLRRRRFGRGGEVRQGIAVGQFRLESRHIKLRRHKIALIMPPLGVVHGRIELNKRIASFYRLSVMDMDSTHDAGLERLNHLGMSARNDFSLCRGDDVDPAQIGPCERDAE